MLEIVSSRRRVMDVFVEVAQCHREIMSSMKTIFLLCFYLFGLGMVVCVDMNAWAGHKQLFSAYM